MVRLSHTWQCFLCCVSFTLWLVCFKMYVFLFCCDAYHFSAVYIMTCPCNGTLEVNILWCQLFTHSWSNGYQHFPATIAPLLWQTTSELWCLSGGKRGDYQNCSVLYCVQKLCTVISTLWLAVLTVLWIGFRHTGPISLCVDLFVFICVYFVCFCFILHSCCIIVSTVGWTWWDWSLILRTLSSFSALTLLVGSFDS